MAKKSEEPTTRLGNSFEEMGRSVGGYFGGDQTRKYTGTSKQYTSQSLADLYALGGNLTQYTDTLESLKDYSPEKYDAQFEATETTSTDWLGNETTNTNYNYLDSFSEADVKARRDKMLPGMLARLGSIKTQKDQPGRNQLLGNQSLLG